MLVLVLLAAAFAQPALRVGVAGSEPFVVRSGSELEGVSVEIWQAVATKTGWRAKLQPFENVPEALESLAAGKLDIVVGPVTITAERARRMRFSQPYFQSSLSLLSRTDPPTPWQRIRPFFSRPFYVSAGVLLCILFAVGTLIWLAERAVPDSHFPQTPVRGIANGVWFAIVTMSTVGYGDLAPRSIPGRIVTGLWIVISLVAATSLVAGIASTLTLTGMRSALITTAEQMEGRDAAVFEDSPGARFAERYGARLRTIGTLDEGYDLLKNGDVDAVVFDRPQLLYFLKRRRDKEVAVSAAEYARQNYGFALALDSPLVHELNVNLLQLQETGRVNRIEHSWLGAEAD